MLIFQHFGDLFGRSIGRDRVGLLRQVESLPQDRPRHPGPVLQRPREAVL